MAWSTVQICAPQSSLLHGTSLACRTFTNQHAFNSCHAGPVALSESCHVLLVERSETLNTGSAAVEIGDAIHEKGSVPLTKKELKRLAD